jgi:hypothetical protein
MFCIPTDEAVALARRLGVSPEEFIRDYTKETLLGRSLKEKPSPAGLDCIFLDREKIPGKAVCGVYEDRPEHAGRGPSGRASFKAGATGMRPLADAPGSTRGR